MGEMAKPLCLTMFDSQKVNSLIAEIDKVVLELQHSVPLYYVGWFMARIQIFVPILQN